MAKLVRIWYKIIQYKNISHATVRRCVKFLIIGPVDAIFFTQTAEDTEQKLKIHCRLANT